MTRPSAPEQEWWTAEEIAAAGLAEMPGSKRRVNAMADRLNWRGQPELARRRSGRGGGWEYHWTLFPARAQMALLKVPARPLSETPLADRDSAWAWFDGQPEKVKVAARERLDCLKQVEALSVARGRQGAVADVSALHGVSVRTIWNWLNAVDGVRADDWLPHLAPRHRAATRRTVQADIDPVFMDLLKSDYLRFAGPSFASCYRRATRLAAAQGVAVPPERTARRRFDVEVSEATCVLARKGIDALRRMYPAQVRDKSAMHAMEAVNADFHRFDVFVRWPLEPGQDKPLVARPQMVAFQDIYSGRVLAWRLDQTPNAHAVRLAAGDMIEAYGIPHHVLLDNGREFAAKAITGGAPNRYRFKVREDDLPGLFVALGCEIHWATPYAGQSKPIERAFRDMCDSIAKDPRFQGAYTGNRPDAKPEDYGSRAIDLAEFLAVVSEGIEEHNIRQGRRSEVAFGRSFAEVFDASYAEAPIRKATEAQRRLWLMGAEGLRGDSSNGMIRFQGNQYWDSWLTEHAGERLIVRFDPSDLWAGLHVYSADNAYLGHAPCRHKAGFFDVGEARLHQRARKAWMAAEKAAAEGHRRFTAAELGQLLTDTALPTAAATPEAKVVRPVFGQAAPRPDRPEPGPQDRQRQDEAHEAVLADFAAHQMTRVPDADGPRDRFRRALELERALAGGAKITPDQQRWLTAYQGTPEYKAERSLWEDFGDAVFG